MRFRSVVCALVTIGALASRAMAAPAVIKVFEAKAHESAADDSRVLATLPENAQVSVSEDVTDGWRRVRLSDGRVAFVRDAEVTLSAAPTAPAPYPPPDAAKAPVAPIAPPPRPAAAASPATAHIYVKDLHHLAELVKPDSLVYPKATALADRHTAAMAVAIGTGAVGLALLLGSLTVFAHENCMQLLTGAPAYCTKDPNVPALLAGAIVGLIGPLIGLVMEPSRDDLLDVVNEWNSRHADEPFTLERQNAFGH